MKSNEINEINEQLTRSQDDIRTDIAIQASGRPWLNWFPVKEWTHSGASNADLLYLPEFKSDARPPNVDFKKQVREYTLQQALAKSNPMRVTDSPEKMAEEVSKFREVVLYGWESHIRRSYINFAEVMQSDDLKLGDLGWIHPHLMRMGAGPSSRYPELAFVCDVDTRVPNDVRLTKIVDARPRRWKRDSGELVEVPPYLPTDGSDMIANPEYASAEIQDYPVIVPDVMEILVPRQYQDKEFDGRRWHGNIHWVNIRDQELNPDGTVGHFRAVLQAAIRPLKTDLAIVIRALRP